jgi:ParB family transcriptional regulator, chromosome partitioning protein
MVAKKTRSAKKGAKDPADKTAADKTAAEKTAAEKTAAEKTAAESAEQKQAAAKAGKKPDKKRGEKKAPVRGKRKPAAAGSAGLAPDDVGALADARADALAQAIAEDGGVALARYKDPLYGLPVVFAALPLEKVERTSFQRDVSESHVDRLVEAMKRTGAYLDPVIAVRDPDGTYRSPNGGHRLAALTRLGARSVTALVTPDARVAFKILALNTEKAHALKEKALEAIRMLRALSQLGDKLLDDERRGGVEEVFAGELEEPQLASLGAAYEKRPRLAGGAYNPLMKRAEAWLTLPLPEALVERERRGDKLLALDDVITPLVEALRAKGFDSPGLRNVLLARVVHLPPRGQKMSGTFDEILDKAIAKAGAFDVESIDIGDLSAAGAAGASGGDD